MLEEGSYGFVLLPNKELGDKATQLPGEILAGVKEDTTVRSFQYSVNKAHITLYHGYLKNVPEDFVKHTLRALRILRNAPLLLGQLIPYGGNFIFWKVATTDLLWAGHLLALQLAQFLDPAKLSRADEESLQISPAERANLQKYGHPLVLENILLHITIAFNSGGFDSLLYTMPRECFATGYVEEIAFARIGNKGVVDQIVYSV